MTVEWTDPVTGERTWVGGRDAEDQQQIIDWLKAVDAETKLRQVNGDVLADIQDCRAALAGNRAFLTLAPPTAADVVAQVRALTRQVSVALRLLIAARHPELLDTVDPD